MQKLIFRDIGIQAHIKLFIMYFIHVLIIILTTNLYKNENHQRKSQLHFQNKF